MVISIANCWVVETSAKLCVLFVIVNVTCMLLSVDQVWYPFNMLNPPNYLLQTVPRRFFCCGPFYDNYC